MITFKVTQETETKEEMADALIHIAEMIRMGYTSGINPHWEIDGEEDDCKKCSGKDCNNDPEDAPCRCRCHE